MKLNSKTALSLIPKGAKITLVDTNLKPHKYLGVERTVEKITPKGMKLKNTDGQFSYGDFFVGTLVSQTAEDQFMLTWTVPISQADGSKVDQMSFLTYKVTV